MQKNTNVRIVTLLGFGVALNVIGAFIAFNLRLPIYLDSIGTVMVAILLGPKYAVLTGLTGSVVSGVTFDIYSIYFAPVQITTGLIAGAVYKKGLLEGRKTPIGVFIYALPTAIVGSVISAFLFGGITSSGSSYIVQILKAIGISDVVSVFLTQIFTDYMDELVALTMVRLALKTLPKNIMLSITAK
ncbi:ECF transporter S component [Romboutsia lituseburensis]|uniref:ECF transporter S component n=1 Tax=Romboutsia lituseburensis TaxID=1537 RepID=UPI00215A2140|nr:ECF transporter S component [Romboutsia lituseburensis]MCR8744951.1 ECF transporter S component [Romboutsia lituseburensis]